MENPFILEPHVPKEYFCDRTEELDTLLYYVTNKANVTLISPRRYGKTGLIFRAFDELHDSKADIACFYVDIYSSHTLEGFISLLTEAVLKVLRKKAVIEKFLDILGAIRPTLSYDPFTNSTSVSYTFATQHQRQQTLKSILDYLEHQTSPVIVAIDEFQQIREFDDDVNVEALLRTYIQPLKNVHFIFCGSKKHVMINMFTDASKPFYESTQCMFLEPINREVYRNFIREMFLLSKRTVTGEAIDTILDWSFGHTFYTQTLCYHLFMKCKGKIDVKDVYVVADMMLRQRVETFMEQRNLLTDGQWRFLTAVAKEGILVKPTSAEFLQKYKLGSASAATRMLNALIDKEMILVNSSMEGNSYRVYNVFLSRWLESQR